MTVSQRLRKLADAHDDARRTVSLYALEQGERICSMSMADVAAETFTSKPTLVRVARQLGFNGWPEFCRAYERELVRRFENENGLDFSLPFGEGASAREVLDAVCRIRAESARETAELQDEHALETAAHTIAHARRIALMGVANNAPLLILFRQKLMQIGIAPIYEAQEDLSILLATLTPQDCTLIMSYTGESEQRPPVQYVNQIKSMGCPVIAITGENDSYLRRHADIVLTMLSRERLYAKVGTFSTEESAACLLDVLYGCIVAQHYQETMHFKMGNYRLIEELGLPGNHHGRYKTEAKELL